MSVEELIQKLKEMPPSAKVWFSKEVTPELAEQFCVDWNDINDVITGSENDVVLFYNDPPEEE